MGLFFVIILSDMTGESELSEREQEILKLVATGASNKDIAQQLVISTNTVKVHLRNIFAKIGVASRTEATLFAFRTGLTPAPANELGLVGRDGDVQPPGDEVPPSILSLENSGSPVVVSEPRVEPLDGPAPESQAKPKGAVHGRRRVVFWIGAGLLVMIAVLAVAVSAIRRQPSLTGQPGEAVTLLPLARWQTLAPLPVARSNLAAVFYERLPLPMLGQSCWVKRFMCPAGGWTLGKCPMC